MSNERRERFTKRVSTEITTKEGIKQAAQELLEKVKKGLKEIDEHISMELLEQSAVGKDIEELKRVQGVLDGSRFRRRIESLADARPEAPDYDDENRDKINDQISHYRQLNQLFKEYASMYQNGVKKSNKIQENPELAAKVMYENLASSFGSDLKKPTYPENYMSVSSLKKGLEKLTALQGEFIGVNRKINEDIGKISSKASPSERIKIYQEATNTLKIWKEAFTKTHKEIETIVDKLYSIESDYENAVERNDSLIVRSKELLKGTRLKLALNYLEPGENSFNAVRQDLAKLTEPLANSKQPTSFQEMQKATKVYNDQADKLTLSYTVFHEKIEAIEAKVKDQIRKTELHIDSQQKSFSHLATDIKKQLKDALLRDSTDIASIEEKFREAIQQTNVKNMEPLAFAQAKLSALQKISEELKAQILVEQERIREGYKNNIGLINAEINKRRSAILEDVKKGQFKFTPTEEEVKRTIEEYKTSLSGSVEVSIDGLKEIHEEAKRRKAQFDETLEDLETVIETHETAKNLVTRIVEDDITAPEFVKIINKSSRGSELLAAMSRYPNGNFNESALISILNDHLVHFDKKGLAAVKAFVEHSSENSDAKRVVIQKLAFLEVLEAKGIDYNSFLVEEAANKNVIAAVLYLKKQNQTDFISEDNLHNEAFCDAIVMLRDQKIELTKEIVSELVKDPNKCAVIKQQIEQYQQHLEEYKELKQEYEEEKKQEFEIPASRRPIATELFKALLLDFLKVEPEVAKAVNAIIKGKEANNMDQGTVRVCPPWLVVAVKEDKRLQEILTKDQNLDANMQFLAPIFEQSDAKNIHLKNYLSENLQMRLYAHTPIITTPTANKALLTQLVEANNNKLGPIDLKKMGVVMKKINEFIIEQEKNTYDAAELKSLKDFRNEAIPVLLSNQKPSEKQKTLEGLADTHFKQTGFFGRLMECIVEAFQSIMPAKLLSSAHQSFFSPQKIDAMRSIKQGLAEAKKAEEETPEQVVDPTTPTGP